MIVQIGDTVYNFIFMFFKNPPTSEWTHTTVCQIFNLTDEIEEPIWSATAFCSAEDVFNENFGKMLTLKRALSNSDFDRLSRTQVWEKYKNKFN